MPYYRITIWLKHKKKPLQGIRQMPQFNIDIVFIMVKDSVFTKIDSSQVLDVEVAMLPKLVQQLRVISIASTGNRLRINKKNTAKLAGYHTPTL